MSYIFLKVKNFVWRQALKYLVNPNEIVKVHDEMFMHLDDKDSLLLSLKPNYEPEHTKFMKSIVKKGDFVVDVGANIGYYTLLLSKLVGSKGKVFAFEPDPKNFKILKRNIEENKLKNVILENKAVSDKNGEVYLFTSKINSGDSRTYYFEGNENKVKIKSIKLDSYFKRIKNKPNFVKVDVQGFEPAVINGMKKLLNDKKITFTTEFWIKGIESANFCPKRYLNFLSSKGFDLNDLEEKKKIKNLDQFTQLQRKSDYFTTLICSKNKSFTL